MRYYGDFWEKLPDMACLYSAFCLAATGKQIDHSAVHHP